MKDADDTDISGDSDTTGDEQNENEGDETGDNSDDNITPDIENPDEDQDTENPDEEVTDPAETEIPDETDVPDERVQRRVRQKTLHPLRLLTRTAAFPVIRCVRMPISPSSWILLRVKSWEPFSLRQKVLLQMQRSQRRKQ